MARERRTLLDLARWRAETCPERGYHFLGNGRSVTDSMTYAELDRAARSIAATMHDHGVQRGDRALLVYSPGLEFVRAFWACFYAGVVAVPTPAPYAATLVRALARLRAVASDCEAAVLLTSTETLSTVHTAIANSPEVASMKTIITDGAAVDATRWDPRDSSSDDIAVIQYTSGSTRAPLGVVVTHANMLHNLEMLRTFHLDQEHMVMISWLPLHHDMGLIRGMMSPLHMGGDCFLMAPMDFVQRPSKWLAAITAFGGTTTGAPNFGFELCVRKVSDADAADLDLSTLRVAFCSAEPIRSQTVERFVARFAPHGFRRAAFRPAYGLAEATVMVTGEMGDGPSSVSCSKSALREGRVVASSGDDARVVISCGRSLGDQEIVVVDEAGMCCARGHVGEIWVRGPSVARGYWQKGSETGEVFGARLADGSGPFLRTGDLGFWASDGGLCLTGRSKDLIIVRGQNYYPQDIEAAVEAASPELRAGCSAAFAVEGQGGDEVIVACEYVGQAAGDDAVMNPIIEAIRTSVSEEHDLALAGVCFVSTGGVPKTTSGKVQRALARRMYLDGSIGAIHSWTGTHKRYA